MSGRKSGPGEGTDMAEILEVSDSGSFDLAGSFCPDSPEVLEMAAREAEGFPLATYEFMQGQVDYGKAQPPPRVYFIRRSGRREQFHENSSLQHGDDPIVSIEFFNAGKELSPDELTLVRHGGNGQKLGQHGRGISVTLTYLASRGIATTVQSHFQGKKWQAVAQLKPAFTGISSHLRVTGSFQGRAATNETYFRVENPPQEFLDKLGKIPDTFLYANPRYSKAVIVPVSSDAQTPPQFSFEGEGQKGILENLDGVVAWPENGSLEVFVDGLRVKSDMYYPFLFPWHFDRVRGTISVGRSHTSNSITADFNALRLLQTAVRSCTDVAFFKKLIEKSELRRYSPFAELHEERYASIGSPEFTNGAKSALLAAWEALYPNAVVCSSQEDCEKLRAQKPHLQAKVMPEILYEFLKKGGVPTVETALNIKSRESIELKYLVEVRFIDDERSLELAFHELAQHNIEIVLEGEGEDKKLEIRFPYAVGRIEDFFDHQKPGAQLIRVLAIIAKKLGIAIECVSYLGQEMQTLHFEVRRTDGCSFRTPIIMDTIDVATTEKSAGYPQGVCIATLRGTEIAKLNPPRTPEELRNILEEAQARIAEEKNKRSERIPVRSTVALGSSTKGPPKTKRFSTRREFLRTTGLSTAGLAAAVGAAYIAGINIRLFPDGDSINVPGRESNAYTPLGNDDIDWNLVIGNENSPGGAVSGDSTKEGHEGWRESGREGVESKRDIDGYYRSSVGDTLFIHPFSGRAMWTSEEEFDGIEVPQSPPKDYATLYRFSLYGEQPLGVKLGESIAGYEVKGEGRIDRFFYDKRTGLYRIKGVAPKVTVYTVQNDPACLNSKPIGAERNSDVSITRLPTDWQTLLEDTRTSSLPLRDKAKRILEKWGSELHYASGKDLDELVHGNSVPEVVGKLVNARMGICNTSATAAVELLRYAGVPARVAIGEWIQQGESRPHMWVEYWNGKCWIQAESQDGSSLAAREVTNIVRDAIQGMTTGATVHKRNSEISFQKLLRDPRSIALAVASLVAGILVGRRSLAKKDETL